MAQFIYYRDGDEEKGPFDEVSVLNLYNSAEFTSHVAFQIRSSEEDSAAPFVQLRDLISKNGPMNPFREDASDIHLRIAKVEKQLEELRTIAAKKNELERKVDEIEKNLEERKNASKTSAESNGFPTPLKKEDRMKTTKGNPIPNVPDKVESKSSKAAPTKPAAKKEEAKKKAKTKANPIPNFPGATVERFSMDNDLHGRAYRKSLMTVIEKEPLIPCAKSMLVLANMKQCFMHSILGCHCVPDDVLETFSPDFARWKEEDEGRLSMGRRLFSSLTSEEKGSLRPQTDFIEEISLKLKKEMILENENGIERARVFLNSDAAKKLKDRLEKHCREAKGKLVCNHCEVACKNHIHFLIHISTLEHRMKVKGTNFEFIALLIGWFNRDIYLNVADESEMDESIEADLAQLSMMDAWRIMGFPLNSSYF